MQLLAAQDHADGNDVGRGVVTLEVAVAAVMADAVDDARGEHGNGQHLDGEDGDTDDAEQHQVNDGQHHHAHIGEAGEHVALHPVVRGAPAVLLQRLGLGGLGAVQFRALEQDLFKAQHLRAVRVLLGLAFSVVLAMHRDPLAGDDTGSEPQPEAEKHPHGRMQVEATVGLLAMQVNGDSDDGQVTRDHGEQDVAEQSRASQPEKEIHKGVLVGGGKTRWRRGI